MSYTTKSGDTWDGIAKTVYGDELKADVLMTATESISRCTSLIPGWCLPRRKWKLRRKQTKVCRLGKVRCEG